MSCISSSGRKSNFPRNIPLQLNAMQKRLFQKVNPLGTSSSLPILNKHNSSRRRRRRRPRRWRRRKKWVKSVSTARSSLFPKSHLRSWRPYSAKLASPKTNNSCRSQTDSTINRALLLQGEHCKKEPKVHSPKNRKVLQAMRLPRMKPTNACPAGKLSQTRSPRPSQPNWAVIFALPVCTVKANSSSCPKTGNKRRQTLSRSTSASRDSTRCLARTSP